MLSNKSSSELFTPPYDYTVEDIEMLPNPSYIEAELWLSGKRKQVINIYMKRAKIKDKKLATWMFFVCSTIANNCKRELEKIIISKFPANNEANNYEPPYKE